MYHIQNNQWIHAGTDLFMYDHRNIKIHFYILYLYSLNKGPERLFNLGKKIIVWCITKFEYDHKFEMQMISILEAGDHVWHSSG